MMTLDVLADYYSLQAILSDRRGSDHPDLVGEARGLLTRIGSPIAACFSDYMFLICMGEARHAVGSPSLWYWEEIPRADGRIGAYKFAVGYDPVKTLPQLSELFDQSDWGGSYGGEKWKHIADVALLYRQGQMSDSIFIDHVADLKHNGGTQFSKSEVQGVIDFSPKWSSDYHGLSNFLTYKRDTLDYFSGVGRMYFKSLSLPVGRLVIRYMQRIGLKPDKWDARPLIEYEPFKFGDQQLSHKSSISSSPKASSPKTSSSGKSSEKLDESMYLSEDEMYDPAEAKHDPKASGPTGAGEPAGTKPTPAQFSGSPTTPAHQEPEETGTEAKDDSASFAAWLVSASAQLP